MAIDTAAKRFSMLNFGDGTNIHLLFEPDGAVDLDDRQHLLDCYGGVAFSEAAAATADDNTAAWYIINRTSRGRRSGGFHREVLCETF